MAWIVGIVALTSCSLLALQIASTLCNSENSPFYKGENCPLPLGGSEQNQTLIVLAFGFIALTITVSIQSMI